MTVRMLVERMQLEVLAGERYLDQEIEGGCVGDLLSYVMAKAVERNMWVTIQAHINTLAVATLVGVSVIVLTDNRMPNEEVLAKGEEEGIPIVRTPLSSFDFCGAYTVLCKGEGVVG